MCTLSITAAPEGYVLWFNRDEQHSRLPERPPALHTAPIGTPWLGPTDAQADGTWCATFPSGLTAALLNHYPLNTNTARPQFAVSRGLLPIACAGCADADTALSQIAASDLQPFGPFRLLLIDAQRRIRILTWDRRRKRRATASAPLMLSSSSFAARRVLARRRAHWQRLRHPAAGFDPQAAFHLWADARDPAASALMRRSDARTVSILRLQVTQYATTLQYHRVADDPQAAIPAPHTWAHFVLPRAQ